MFVPSKAFRIFLGDSCLILLKKQKVCAHENNFHFLPESDKIPIPTAVDQYKNYLGCPNFSGFFGVTEVFETYRLLQTVLFLTDSVFRVLFAYFDESMASIGGYEP